MTQFREDGFTDEQLARVYSPIGLRIGAVTPEEIAISIIAEIIQVKRMAHQPEKRIGTIRPIIPISILKWLRI